MTTQEMDKWISVKERLPDFDVKVLIYWKLPKSDKKGEFYDMIEIAYVNSITQGKDYKNAEWKDDEHNGKYPTHWMELPSPPKP